MTNKLVIVLVLLGMCGLAFSADILVQRQVVTEQQKQYNSAMGVEEGKHETMVRREKEEGHKLSRLAEEQEAREGNDATDKKLVP